MNDHEHDYWRTRSGALVCACGARRPLPEGDIMPAPELTPAERAIVDRIHDPEATDSIPDLIAEARAYGDAEHRANIENPSIFHRLADALESLSAPSGDDREALWDVADDFLDKANIEDLNPPSLIELFADLVAARGFRRPSPVTREALIEVIQGAQDKSEDRAPGQSRAEWYADAIVSKFFPPEPAEDEWEYGRQGDFGDGVERVMLDSQAEALGGVSGGVPMRRSPAVPAGPWVSVKGTEQS